MIEDVERGLCSIVLPTYNRADFLPDAFAAIRAQSFEHFELIVVDDGSTDDTQTRIAELTPALSQPTHVVHQQPNRGAGSARNLGIDLARGEFVAFYDSDDLWLPHHLADCIDALRRNPEVGFVYAASRFLDLETGRVLEPHSFYEKGRPRSFLKLRTRRAGRLRIIEDPRACLRAIRSSLGASLHVSVFRRRLFDDGLRLPDLRIGEDRYFLIQALKRGVLPAYLPEVHEVRRVHAGNVSLAGRPRSHEHATSVVRGSIEGHERLLREQPFTAAERRAQLRRLAHDRFWLLGYNRLARQGRLAEAIDEYRRALAAWPWDPFMWKTYMLALIRHGRKGSGRHPPIAGAIA